MKKMLIAVVAISAAYSVAAYAGPKKLTKEQLDQVVAGVPSVNQQAAPPGQFPGGNPSTANGQSNNPSGKK